MMSQRKVQAQSSVPLDSLGLRWKMSQNVSKELSAFKEGGSGSYKKRRGDDWRRNFYSLI
jgi:hypothetical protein